MSVIAQALNMLTLSYAGVGQLVNQSCCEVEEMYFDLIYAIHAQCAVHHGLIGF